MKLLKKMDNKFVINLFLSLFAISIVLDMHVFYNSTSTLIRSIIICLFFGYILLVKCEKKDLKTLGLYGGVLLLYILFHHINALHFHSLVPGNFNYSLISELLYIWKMLSNVLLFYIVKKLNIEYVNIRNFIKLVVMFMTITIVVGDLVSLSYTAYGFSKTSIPLYKWFSLHTYDFIAGSGKGFFHLTNQVVALFLLYTPITCYECFKNKKIYDYVLIIMICLSMMIIGNRLAIYGMIIELSILTIIYFLLNIKKRTNWVFYIFNVVAILGIILMIPRSPLAMRNYYYDAIYSDQSISFMERDNQVSKYEYYEDYKYSEKVVDKFEDKEIDPNFVMVSYPYKYDKDFWDNLIKENEEMTGNARYVEQKMVQRVKDINDNWLDNVFGLTYTRVINIFNIEKDFVMQFYSIGIFGIILLLGLYFYLFIYIGIKILFDFKNKFNELNISLLLGTSILFISSYFSGNILNSINMIIPLAVILTILYNEVRKKKPKKGKEKILGFDVSLDAQEEIVQKVMKAKEQTFIVNINPLIVLDHRKDEKKKEIFNQQLVQIPDGEGVVLVSKLRGGNIEKRIAGIDLMLALCEDASKNGKKIYLYGSKEGVASAAKKKLEDMYHNIKIVGYMNGYTKQEDVITDINKSKAEVLFVALGSPLQEDFIINNMSKLKNVKVFMPVGGSMDVISGNLKRAPRIMQKLKLEWLYRMILEPKRLKGIFRLMKFVIISIFDKEA